MVDWIELAPPIAQAGETYLAAMARYGTTPPQTETECAEYRNERLATEYIRHSERIARIYSLYDDAMAVSFDIYEDDANAVWSIFNERRAIAQGQAATAIAAAKAILARCILKADLIPAPGNIAAALECLGWYALKKAGIIATLNRAIAGYEEDREKGLAFAQSERNTRELNIKLRMDSSLGYAERWHSFVKAVIQSDYEHCIARVNDES